MELRKIRFGRSRMKPNTNYSRAARLRRASAPSARGRVFGAPARRRAFGAPLARGRAFGAFGAPSARGRVSAPATRKQGAARRAGIVFRFGVPVTRKQAKSVPVLQSVSCSTMITAVRGVR